MSSDKEVIDDGMSRLTAKHQKVDSSYNTVTDHMDEFRCMENRLLISDIKHRALSTDVRGATRIPPPNRHSSMNYHWICQSKKQKPYLVSYVQKPMKLYRRPFLKDRTGAYEYTYRMYLDCLHGVEGTCHVSKKYVVRQPDEPIGEEDHKLIIDMAVEMMDQFPTLEECIVSSKLDCQMCFKERVEHYETKYQNSRNEYYLGRSIFWRNLRVDDLTANHQALVSIVYRNIVDPDMIEGELRAHYEKLVYDRIGLGDSESE